MSKKQQPHAFTVDERGRIFELRAIGRCNSETGETKYEKPEPGQWVLVPGVLLHDSAAKLPRVRSMTWSERFTWALFGMLFTVILGQRAGFFP